MTLKFVLFATLALTLDETTFNTFLNSISATFSQLLETLDSIIFFSIGGPEGMPLIVIWLISGGLFFTFRMKFINIRAFKHAIDVVRGKYDDPDEPGEVSHFQALATALSGTVGLGNIAGVAVAIGIGGPGASLWMTVAGLLGMTTKFVECTLGQKYRIVRADGTVAGGPMYYLSSGLAEIGQKTLGRVLAVAFAFLGICGTLATTTLFQSNQSGAVVGSIVPFFADRPWVYGSIVATLVGLVIIGGIKRIATVAAAIVPAMCGIYFLAALWVIAANFMDVPEAIATIFQGAFAPEAVAGGFVGALVQGFRRAAFSNEAGLGFAAIAHAAAKTEEPVREGIVALLEPFIDTVIICNLTAIVVIITGAYNNPEFTGLDGATLTLAAFGTVSQWLPSILAIAIFLFAFSSIISAAYYGEICWQYLFSEQSQIVYKILCVLAVFVGAVTAPEAIIKFGDAVKTSLAIPSLLGAYLLSGKVAAELEDYTNRFMSNGKDETDGLLAND
ncbi:MAG: alanine/glycine:cation symporter family protein [Cyanobacteriota bacterium]|nr:alanine/glycine:cation symporter family protein [Cyanobacteriota bacterium]